jgi:hypothetical protein
MFRIASARITRFLVAPILALWIAGTGCLFGCEVNILAAESTQQTSATAELGAIVSGEACASSKSHDCCARKQTTKRTSQGDFEAVPDSRLESEIIALPGSPQGSMTACPLAVNATAVVNKQKYKHAIASAASTHLRLLLSHTVEQDAHSSGGLHLANRCHTYLRCCTFLI